MSEQEQPEAKPQQNQTQRQKRHTSITRRIRRQVMRVRECIRQAKRKYKEHKEADRGYPGNYLYAFSTHHWSHRGEYWRIFRDRWTAERVMLLATVVMAAATFVQVFIARYQWLAMNEQTAQLITQNETMIAQTDEMGKQTTAMIGQTTEMVKSNKVLVEQTDLAKGQLKQAEIAAGQTKTIIDRSAMEQRAWLSPVKPEVRSAGGRIANIVAEEAFWVNIELKNYGRTPAYVSGRLGDLDIHASDTSVEQRITKVESQAKSQAETFPIAADAAIKFGSQARTFFPDEIKSVQTSDPVKDGATRLFFVGAAIYSDVYGEVRTIRYCFVWDPDIKKFVLYPKFQYMD